MSELKTTEAMNDVNTNVEPEQENQDQQNIPESNNDVRDKAIGAGIAGAAIGVGLFVHKLRKKIKDRKAVKDEPAKDDAPVVAEFIQPKVEEQPETVANPVEQTAEVKKEESTDKLDALLEELKSLKAEIKSLKTDDSPEVAEKES